MNYWETPEWKAARTVVLAAHQALLAGAMDCPWAYGPEFFQYQADVMQPLRDALAEAVEAKNRIADTYRYQPQLGYDSVTQQNRQQPKENDHDHHQGTPRPARPDQTRRRQPR